MAATPHYIRSISYWGNTFDEAVAAINAIVDELDRFRTEYNTVQGGTPFTLSSSLAYRVYGMDVPGNPITAAPDTTPASVTVVSGDAQTPTAGTQATNPLVAVVKNAGGTALSGVAVAWSCTGDGVVSASSSTNSSGNASTTLIAPTFAGAYTVTASVGSLSASFSGTSVAGAAANVDANSVLSQSGTTSGAVTTKPSVRVTDAYGNPVSGTTVTFAVTGGGGSGTTLTPTTSASGIATVGSWTLGASAGLNTMTATVSGATGSPVTFTANGVASAPTQLSFTSGANQTGITAGSAATASQVTVKDAGNSAVQGVTVTFTTTSGSLSATSAVTNASGQASTTLTTAATVGTATITASFTDANGALVSTTTTVASTFGTKSKLALQTQPSSSGSSGTALSQQPIVLIQDANGNTVTNATDTITASVQSGNATISGGSTKAAVAGVATFSGLTLVDVDGGSNVLRFSTGALATVDSSGTTLAPPVPVALQFQGAIGNAASGVAIASFNVQVVDASNVIVPGATNAVTIALTTPGAATLSGTKTVNAASGVATFTGLSVDTAGTYTFTATASGLTSAVSGSFSITSASTAFPNEPGYTLIAEHDCASSPTSTPASVGIAGKWANFTGSVGSVDPTGLSPATFNPYGDAKVWRFQYPSTQAIGSGSANLQGWSASPFASQLANKSSMYLAFWFCAYGNGTTFEMATTQIKPWGYIGYGVSAANSSAQNQGYWILQTSQAPGSLVTTLDLSWLQQGTGHVWPSGVTIGTITVGQWYLFESKHVINSAVDVADGTMDAWLTPYGGTTTHVSRSNIVYKWTDSINSQVNSAGFSLWKDNNIYGGHNQGFAKSRTDYFLIAHPKITGNP